MTFPTTLALVEALRSRKISAVELARAACERIEAHDRQVNHRRIAGGFEQTRIWPPVDVATAVANAWREATRCRPGPDT